MAGEIASKIEEKKNYWSFARTRVALRQRLRVVRDFVYRGDRGSHLADEDEKFPRDFYGDNAPGRKDNAPGNTGRGGHDYPLLFLPTG